MPVDELSALEAELARSDRQRARARWTYALILLGPAALLALLHVLEVMR